MESQGSFQGSAAVAEYVPPRDWEFPDEREDDEGWRTV